MGVKAGAEHPQQSAGPMLLINKIGFVCFYDSSVVCVRQTHIQGTKTMEEKLEKEQKYTLFTINTSKQISQDIQVYGHSYNTFKIIF